MISFEELATLFAQIWMVASCTCRLKRSKSLSHLSCITTDPWIDEQLIECSKLALDREMTEQQSEIDNFADSMDSLLNEKAEF